MRENRVRPFSFALLDVGVVRADRRALRHDEARRQPRWHARHSVHASRQPAQHRAQHLLQIQNRVPGWDLELLGRQGFLLNARDFDSTLFDTVLRSDEAQREVFSVGNFRGPSIFCGHTAERDDSRQSVSASMRARKACAAVPHSRQSATPRVPAAEQRPSSKSMLGFRRQLVGRRERGDRDFRRWNWL